MTKDTNTPKTLDDGELDEAQGGLRIDEMTFFQQSEDVAIVGRPRHQGASVFPDTAI